MLPYFLTDNSHLHLKMINVSLHLLISECRLLAYSDEGILYIDKNYGKNEVSSGAKLEIVVVHISIC